MFCEQSKRTVWFHGDLPKAIPKKEKSMKELDSLIVYHVYGAAQ